MLLNIDRHNESSLAVVDAAGCSLTYGELSAFASQLAGQQPERVLAFVLTENNVGGVAWCIGAIASQKIVPLILNAHTDQQLFESLYERYHPKFVCMPQSCEHLLSEKWSEQESKYGYTLYRTENKTYPLYDELSHLLPTSGSTGSPKLVRHKYDNIEASARNIATFFELTPAERPLLVLPLYYTMGLSVVFSHFLVGATVLVTNLAMTDRGFWNFIKTERATSFTGVPYSFEILNLMRFFRMDLPDLTLLTQGGGKMSHELNLKFAEFCRDNGKRWIATYGQSEGTARMAYLPAKWAIEKCGSIGLPVPNGELFLRNENGEAITTPFVEGEMCYRGGNVTLGYAQKDTDLVLGDERNGFLRTGDLAYFDADGCYYIVGRLGRFLKLFGLRIGLDECEQILKSQLPVACACVGTDVKMIVYITDEQYANKAKMILVEKTHLVASAIEVRTIDKLPQNEAGKILYSQLKKV